MNEESFQKVERQRAVTTYVLTFFFVLSEWLMFELIRMPYRPVDDMRTLLGTEKYAVVTLMAMIGAGWLGFVSYRFIYGEFKCRQCLAFLGYLAVLAAVSVYFVLFPAWLVTPFKLLWR